MYYIYMIRCEDNSIYTGITTDIGRRMEEHFSQNEKCAKYTLTHKAKKLEAVWRTENRMLASKLEYYIKKLDKTKKEKLIRKKKLEDCFLNSNKIEVEKYRSIEVERCENATEFATKKEM